MDQSRPDLSDGAQLVSRGRTALHSGDSVRAEHYFALAVANGYAETDLLPEILAACLLANRLRSALNYAEPSLRRNPNDSALRYLVATIHLALGQATLARTELQALLVHQPRHANGHFLLGFLEWERDRKQGEAHLRQYLAFAPTGEKVSEASEMLKHGSLQPMAATRELKETYKHESKDSANARPWMPAEGEEP